MHIICVIFITQGGSGKITLKNLLINALISYVIISVDLLKGLKTNFNIVNWSGFDFTGYIVVLLFISGMDIYMEKKRKKKNEPE